jgi:subtilisin-like proprotein convertase family protein
LHGDNGSEYAALKNAWAAVGIGEPADTFVIIRHETSPILAIPDDEAAGVESVLHIEEEGLLKDIYIGIDIEHSYIGDLRVVLESPSAESVVLHDRQGGSSRDIIKTYDLDSYPRLSVFAGDRVQGDWTLSVSDHARVDTGKLMFWELEFSIQKVEKKELTKEATPNQQIPDNDPDGIESLIEVQESGRIVRLDIPVDISHTWIGDLRVLLVSPSGTEVVLHDRSGRSRHDIKKIYSTTTDEPMLALLGSEIQGIWKLKVVYTYSRDIGTLNTWGIHCVYE